MAGFSDGNEINNNKKFRILASSDLHYLDPGLMEYDGAFRCMCEALQEPEMEKIEERMDQLLNQVLLQKPDVYLITGDLSYQGEKMSHLRLAGKLEKLVRAGIHVYAVPGNQDVDNPFSMCWKRDGEKEYTPAESVSAREFEQIYRDMGYSSTDSSVISRAPDSLSYHVFLRKNEENLHLFMLDTTIPQMPQGQIAPGTLAWLEEQLREMAGKQESADGKPIAGKQETVCRKIIAGHHPMLPLGGDTGDYILKNSRDLCRIMRQYQVPIYISGHLHKAGCVHAPDPGRNPAGVCSRFGRFGKWFGIQKWKSGPAGPSGNAPVNISLEKRGVRFILYGEDLHTGNFQMRESGPETGIY